MSTVLRIESDRASSSVGEHGAKVVTESPISKQAFPFDHGVRGSISKGIYTSQFPLIGTANPTISSHLQLIFNSPLTHPRPTLKMVAIKNLLFFVATASALALGKRDASTILSDISKIKTDVVRNPLHSSRPIEGSNHIAVHNRGYTKAYIKDRER